MKLTQLTFSKLPVYVWAGVFFGLAILVLIMAAPQALLQHGVDKAHLHNIFSYVGFKTRIFLAILASFGTLLAISSAFYAYNLTKRRNHISPLTDFPFNAAETAEGADASLFVTPRKPIFADQELGAPLMSPAALERAQSGDGAQITNKADNTNHLVDDDSTHGRATPPSANVQPADFIPITAPILLKSVSKDSRLSLNELILRLEAGLANLTTPPPPLPAVDAAVPQAQDFDRPVVMPLTLVPSVSKPPSNSLNDKMQTLARLVSGLH